MVDDKYIGLALAVSSSVAIGTSFIITKKGLNDAAESSTYTAASDNYSYLRNPTWWAGMSTLVLGEVANFAAYTFAPPILVTPLGALSVLIGAVLASFLLKEELGHIGRVGCTLCLLGSLIIVLHAPEDKEIATVDEILQFALQPGFLMYCFTVLAFSLVMIFAIAPRYGRSNPLVYISICSLVGSISIMAIKGFGAAVKLTFAGNNQFNLWSTYFFGIVVISCILVQMNYFNKALDTFSTNVVNPMYFVCFTTATIVASLILFQGFDTAGSSDTLSLLAGFTVTFLGVHLLNLSRKPDHVEVANAHHSALESGIMNPRMSIQGRMSIDRWNDTAGTAFGGTPGALGHGRRSSLYRAQTTTLFNAFEDYEEHESMGLADLRRVDEEYDEDEEADERTHLRTQERREPEREREIRMQASRSHSNSPRIAQSGTRHSPH